MMFANRFARSVALSALALGTMGVVNAQNGTNYHVLNNNGDGAFVGIGAGGAQTATDGIGTYIAGEDARGALQVNFGGTLGVQFSYRNVAFRENACVFNAGVVSGQLLLDFAGIYFIELDGLNANIPVVFTAPKCVSPIAASFVAYGFGPASTVSFVALATSALGPTQTLLAPDNGFVAGSGTATLVGGGTGTLGPVGSGCYIVQFTWTASAVPYLDNMDAIWHYSVNSPDLNQYWIMSDDELNLHQALTVITDGGFTAVPGFFSVLDYDLGMATLDAVTAAAIAPAGVENNGPYYTQTENMTGVGGINGGFDVGRGSRAVSFLGLNGVKVPAGFGGLGNGAQDPAINATATTLSFVTWDNKPNVSLDGIGSNRVTWLSIDLPQVFGTSPELDPNITKAGGTVRIPVVGQNFLQPVTQLGLGIFLHTTNPAASGWPDPAGITSGAFGVPAIAGGSFTLGLATSVGSVPCNIGLPVNLTYGTSGSNPGFPTLQWDPTVGDVTGTREMYLWK